MTEDNNNANAGGTRKETSVLSLVHPTDLRLTIMILIICGALYYITAGFDEVSELLTQNIPPEWFPRLLIGIIVVLSLTLPFEHRFLKKGTSGIDKDRSEAISPMAFMTSLLLIASVASILLFGTAVAMVVVCFSLPLLWGERRWKVLVPYAILFPLAVGFLFTQLLKVYFEPGAFGPVIN